MAAAIKITRYDLDPAGLRRAARRASSVAASRRMLALALVLEGTSRTGAAQAAGMDRQTLRDWVHRYNEEGLVGLSDRHGDFGPKRLLSPEQEAEVAEWVRRGPDLAEHGVVRWRRADPGPGDRGQVRRDPGRAQHQHRAAPTWLLALGAAPPPSRSRCRGAGVLQTDFAALVDAALPEQARGKPLELWWQDEVRIGQQGTLTRVWAQRGSRPSAPRDQRDSWASLFGAVCPSRGVGAGLALPFANAGMMNLHLAEISANVRPGAHAILTINGAGWHQTGDKLRVPSNITLLQLPPYSPELNPVENIWAYLRGNKLSNRVLETYDTIVDACCEAWNWLTNQPERITEIASREWAWVSQ